jgi:membrane protease YdiL (CAAX protease family)
MRETGIFFLYLFACLALAALLTYPLMETGWIDHAPQRVMGRLAQVFILLGLWPFLKAMGLGSWDALGYGAARSRFLLALGKGWLLGLAILLALAGSLVLLEVRVPDPLGNDWLPGLLKKAAQALMGGLLTSLLEETFFRGALFSAIRRRGGASPAVYWSSFLFALLHFMKPHGLPDGVAFDWAGTGQMFVHVFAGVFQLKHLDSMTALFLVGIFLALIRERTGHIGWCVGLHAGWILVIQVTRYLTDGNGASPYAFLVGVYDGMIGWLAAAWIGLLTIGFWTLSRRRGAGQGASSITSR